MKKAALYFALLSNTLVALWSCNGQSQVHTSQQPPKQVYDGSTDVVLDSTATVVFHDLQNNLWLASTEKGVYKYDGEKLRLFTSTDGLESYTIISVQTDTVGILYFDTPAGVFTYQNDTFKRLPVAATNTSPLDWTATTTDLWFRMGWDRKGPLRFDGTHLHQLHFPKNEAEDAFYKKHPHATINPYAIYTTFKDSQGKVWFGTSNLGVYMFDGKNLSWMHEPHLIETPAGGNFGVRSIAEDKDGHYWMSNAAYKYSLLPTQHSPDRLTSLRYQRVPGVASPTREQLYFYAIQPDPTGNLLMFAKEDGLWLNDGKTLTQLYIKDGEVDISPTAIYRAPNGIIWLGTHQHGLYRYDGKTFEKFVL